MLNWKIMYLNSRWLLLLFIACTPAIVAKKSAETQRFNLAERGGLPSAIPGGEASNKKFCSRTSCSFFIPIRFAGQARHASGNKKFPASCGAAKLFVCGL
jgi:hypothetical protein